MDVVQAARVNHIALEGMKEQRVQLARVFEKHLGTLENESVSIV
jgi:hypothetical protein